VEEKKVPGTYLIVEGDRLIFRLQQGPGALRSASKKNPQDQECGFAHGESLSPKQEGIVFEAAKQAKDWENFLFKLKLEGFDVREGGTFRGPTGKL
jgi:hypothetical protein